MEIKLPYFVFQILAHCAPSISLPPITLMLSLICKVFFFVEFLLKNKKLYYSVGENSKYAITKTLQNWLTSVMN